MLPHYRYRRIRQIRSDEELGRHETYGLQIWQCSADADKLLCTIPDVSTEAAFVQSLAEQCTRLGVQPIHIYEILENVLGAR